MNAEKLVEYDEKLNRYLRLNTFPVAVRFLRTWAEMPERAKRPLKDMGNRFTTCQAIAMSRRFGWVLALGREDSSCVLGAMALGLEKRLPHYTEGNLCMNLYTENLKAGRLSEESVPRLPEGNYVGVATAPLQRTSFEPVSIVIYGNGAQIMRLGQAYLWKRGFLEGWRGLLLAFLSAHDGRLKYAKLLAIQTVGEDAVGGARR